MTRTEISRCLDSLMQCERYGESPRGETKLFVRAVGTMREQRRMRMAEDFVRRRGNGYVVRKVITRYLRIDALKQRELLDEGENII